MAAHEYCAVTGFADLCTVVFPAGKYRKGASIPGFFLQALPDLLARKKYRGGRLSAGKIQ